MKSTMVTTLVGVFALGAKGKVVGSRLFPRNPGDAAERVSRLQRGEVVDELAQLLESMRVKGYEEFLFEDENLASNVERSLNLKCRAGVESAAALKFREKLGEIMVQLEEFSDLEEFHQFIHQVTLALAEKAVTRETEKRDLHAIQVIRTLDDLDRTLNLFSGRIREWYGLHFPELDKLVDKHETYLRLVSDLGVRENFTTERLVSEGLPVEKAKIICEKARESIGFAANPQDLEVLRLFSKNALELFRSRGAAEDLLSMMMEEVAPNTTAILGPLLAARLMSIAGSLRRLAEMPSSTIQVLGAEKALFRSLKTGSRPPKHGIIFQYQPLHTAPRWQRGKISRTLASKLSIAARIDAFRGEFIGDKLKESVEKRIREIQERYPAPPPVRSRNERARGSRT
ncbi:MAG: C/D box methylation guide ribonucleoprotein complex aNOP56 subunit [Candidatus Bathyarchaeia archaeon]